MESLQTSFDGQCANIHDSITALSLDGSLDDRFVKGVLPSITLDAKGGEICSFNKRIPCKVRSRTYVTQRIMNWMQVYGRRTRYSIRIQFPYAM